MQKNLLGLDLNIWARMLKFQIKHQYTMQAISVLETISRIDEFCVLLAGTGGIVIGNNVHIAVFCSLIGKEVIKINDFANLSSRVSIYSSSDDYSGEYMTNPTIPSHLTNVTLHLW